MDEEGTDVYLATKSGMVERGLRIYAANGCIYCHSQQVSPDYAASDIDRTRDLAPSPAPKWGERRSAPRDYLFDRPVQIGKERMGPDLANIGKAAPTEEEKSAAASAPVASPAGGSSPAAPTASPAPAPPSAAPSPVGATASPSPAPSETGEPAIYSAAWHHRHLYSPRSISPATRDSNMPAYRFLYEQRLIDGERSADALQLTGSDAPPAGWEIVPTYDAKCLVAYLMSLDQSHPLKEVKSTAPAAAPAAAKGAK